MIILPVACLLLLAALVLETLHIMSLYRHTNTEQNVYKTCVAAEQYMETAGSTYTEQARLFVYSGDTRHLEAYFAETGQDGYTVRAMKEIVGSGDPYGLGKLLTPLTERSKALREKELHAMKLAAVSYGMNLSKLPQEVAEYPLTAAEERLNSEQMRDEASALLYGDAYCAENSAVAEERQTLFAGAAYEAETKIREMNKETDVSLKLQRVLLGVSVAAVAALILFLRRQRILDAQAEQAHMAELEAAKDRAETEDRTKTAFLLNISHDIRMPMNEILGFTNLAQKHIDEPERVKESLRKIKSSSGQLLGIINDILELNRLENSTLAITEVPADMMRSGEEIQAMLTSQAVSKGVAYTLDIRGIRDRYVYVDIMHMVTVLTNLVSNAIKFTPAGGSVCLEIEQCTPAQNGRASYRFTVRDTGKGMSPEFVKRLFDPYTREKVQEEGMRGAGLGLTITKRLVDRMGGTIDVESEQGKGSVFTVTMPFRIQTEAEVEVHYGSGHAEDTALVQRQQNLRGMRVLLADDNELAREITGEILRSEGAETEKATDGADALRLFTEKQKGYYGLILLDAHMPVMNGFEAAVQIRKLQAGHKVPIIALASVLQEEDKVNAQAAGINMLLTKPLDINELMTALRQYC